MIHAPGARGGAHRSARPTGTRWQGGQSSARRPPKRFRGFQIGIAGVQWATKQLLGSSLFGWTCSRTLNGSIIHASLMNAPGACGGAHRSARPTGTRW